MEQMKEDGLHKMIVGMKPKGKKPVRRVIIWQVDQVWMDMKEERH